MNMKDEMQWATDLLAKYPKTKGLMEQWAKGELVDMQTTMMAEIADKTDIVVPEITDEMASQYAMVILAANQYAVLDFLDSQKQYVNLTINEISNRKVLTKSAIEVGFEFLNN